MSSILCFYITKGNHISMIALANSLFYLSLSVQDQVVGGELMIKTVLIDVDDTLLDFKECSITAIKQSMLDFNFLYKDEYYDVFQKENNRLWQMIENQTLTIEELHLIRWKNIFNHINNIFFSIKHLYLLCFTLNPSFYSYFYYF